MDDRGATRLGGQVTNPGGTERLHEYWVHGEGAAKIRWGEPGDFQRCVDHLGKFIKDPKGYCNLAHHAALGIYPATHAAMEHKAGRSQVSEPAYDGDGLDASWDGDHSDLPDLTGLDVHHLEAAAGHAADPAASRAAKLGSGARFKKLKASLAAKGARDPGALAAHIGRKKYGKAKFMSLAAKARGGTKRSEDVPAVRGELMRDYPLEDLHIVRSADGGDGRTMEAFSAVFNTEAEIRDHEGHYLEVIEPSAFNKRIDDLRRSRQGLGQVKVLFNHGRDMEGNLSERFLMPVAVPVSIEATPRGLLTRSRFVETALGEEVLELVRAGAVTAHSFTGRIIRSAPQIGRARHRPDSAGQLTVVRRMELGLREFGPVLFPAYEGAGINGVRMSTPGTWEPDEEEIDTGTSPDGEAAAGEPLTPDGAEHSARYHQHALYTLRSKELREKAGLVW